MTTNFYVHPEDVQDDRVRFRADETRHIASVLRKASGDMIVAVDGQGNEYSIVLDRIGATSAEGRIVRRRRLYGEPIAEVTLAQGLPKGAKLGQIIQKGTELGVSAIWPLMTEHTVVAPGRRPAGSKIGRWQRIAIGAMKQSRRTRLPRIRPPMGFDEMLTEISGFDLALMAALSEDALPLGRVLSETGSRRRILILVGPEGGFSGPELERARSSGVRLITLGPRRLRAETAAIVFLGLVMFRLGEMDERGMSHSPPGMENS
jgi:16S rRNA (uracil1498-N3)-methyltransferase